MLNAFNCEQKSKIIINISIGWIGVNSAECRRTTTSLAMLNAFNCEQKTRE